MRTEAKGEIILYKTPEGETENRCKAGGGDCVVDSRPNLYIV